MALLAISGKIGSGKSLTGKIIQYLTWHKEYLDEEEKFLSFNDWCNKYTEGKSDWELKSFAGKLKQIVSLLIGCNIKQLEDIDFKNSYLGEEWNYQIDIDELVPCYDPEDSFKYTIRQLMQRLGTECGRDIIHPNIWINALFADYKITQDKSIKKAFNEFITFGETTVKQSYPDWIITDCRFKNEFKAIKDRNGIVIRVNRPNPLRPGKIFADVLQYDKDYAHISETDLDNEKFDYVVNNNSSIEDLIKQVKNILIKENII